MTKGPENVAKEMARVQLSLRDEQSLMNMKTYDADADKDTVSNYNADATQLQCKRKCNAECDKYQKDLSKNSEPLLSLLDLSKHKNQGVT